MVSQVFFRAFALALIAGPARALDGTGRTSLGGYATNEFDFHTYANAYGRTYVQAGSRADEYLERQSLFETRVKDIKAHNANTDRLWTAGINDFTDHTHAEFASRLGWRGHGDQGSDSEAASLLEEEGAVELATTIDWRTNLTSLKSIPNQGACGSCWAVTSSAVLEARYEISRGKFRAFSAQQLVNCVPNPGSCGGTGGCGGATVELAMTYVQKHGLSTEKNVPYTGANGKCSAGKALIEIDSRGSLSQLSSDMDHGGGLAGLTYKTLVSNKATPLMRAALSGPVAISVAAEEWSSYSHGVFNSCKKDATLDHAVLLVGYGGGQNGQAKYWTVRNSWGGDYGEKGFIRIFRHNTPAEDDAYCGTDYKPDEGVACKPYPKTQKVCGMCGILFDSVSIDLPATASSHSMPTPVGASTGSVASSSTPVNKVATRAPSLIRRANNEDENDERGQGSDEQRLDEDEDEDDDDDERRSPARNDDDDE